MHAVDHHRWKLGTTISVWVVVALAAVFAAMRAIGALGPPHLSFVLPVGFVLMAVAPWVLLTRSGRLDIGLKRPTHAAIFLQAIALGMAAAIVCLGLGLALFGTSTDNWFVSVAASFGRSVKSTLPVWQLYLMFTIPSMIFSPIGEEIFFRGVLQRALEERFTVRTSTQIECMVFGLVHLCHHGLVFGAAGLTLLPYSGACWFVLMFAVANLFAWLRMRSESLYPAMASHAAFNFAMGTGIFLVLWPVTVGR